MSKYHISKSGKPTLCRATKKPCPLGEHFNTEQEAYEHVQKEMLNEFGVISILNPNKDKVDLSKAYKRQEEIVKTGHFISRRNEEYERTKLAKLALKMKGNNVSDVELDEVLRDLRKPDSGATLSANRNSTKAKIPIVGFCASPYPEYSVVFDNPEDVTLDVLLDFEERVNKESEGIFSQEDVYIGLWNDPATGKIYLDVSKRYDTAEEARIACEQNDQIAYFDLQTFESVDVNREATSGQGKQMV